MKRTILGLLCLLLASLTASTQSVFNPFAKKTWNFPLRNTFVGTRFTSFDVNDNQSGKTTTLSTDFEAMYFPVNHFGIGITYLSDYSWTDNTINRDWLASLALKYGFNLSPAFNIYVRATGGLGKVNYLGRVAGSNNNVKNKGTNKGFSAELGLPIRINSNGTGFLTPFVTYRGEKTDFKTSISDDIDNSILFGLKFEAYINKSQSLWGFKEGYSLAKTRYAQGRSFLGFSNRGYYQSSNTKYDEIINDPELDRSRSEFSLNYNYYLINNLALGVDVGFNREKEEQLGNAETTTRNWSVGPQLTFNIPSQSLLNNVYLQADAHVGKENYELVNASMFPSVDSEFKTSDVSIGIGYTNFISRNIAFSPVLSYRWRKFEQENTNAETTERGLMVRTGLKLFF